MPDTEMRTAKIEKTESIDWNRLWNLEIQRYRRAHGGCDCAAQWQSREKALEYLEMAVNTQSDRIRKVLNELPVDRASRVLDIGSGPGVLTVPLARKTAHVTAVDASAAMIELLRENAAGQKINNIAGISKRWEDVDPENDLDGPYDVVVASLSLAMYDLDHAIEKMQQVCSKYVFLYWFAGMTSWEEDYAKFADFLPFAGKQTAVPKAELLLNVLWQKGINPHIQKFPYTQPDWFDTIDDAVKYFIRRYNIPADCRNRTLRDRVYSMLERCGKGYVLHNHAACVKIWWPVRQAAILVSEKTEAKEIPAHA